MYKEQGRELSLAASIPFQYSCILHPATFITTKYHVLSELGL